MTGRSIRQGILAAATALAIGAAPLWASHDGKHVYKKTCGNCHHFGALGAPVVGDEAAWKPRVAQGRAVLYQHALRGFKGMPAKGANPKLSDQEVRLAVDYMISEVADRLLTNH